MSEADRRRSYREADCRLATRSRTQKCTAQSQRTTDGIEFSGIVSDFCLLRTENQELGTIKTVGKPSVTDFVTASHMPSPIRRSMVFSPPRQHPLR